MSSLRRTARRLAALLPLAALAAPALVAQGMPAHVHAAADTARPLPAGVHAADVAFLQGMIGHHAQALVMTALLDTRTARPAMKLLAERIRVSQRDEIAAMRAWLLDRGLAAPEPDTVHHAAHHAMGDAAHAAMHARHMAAGGHGAHAASAPGGAAHDAHGAGDHASMPGMLTTAQLDSLAGAKGAAFDALFLRYMIAHHEGALVMVQRLFATPGAGQESQLFGFATDVDADQRAEIARMRALLAQYGTPKRRQARTSSPAPAPRRR